MRNLRPPTRMSLELGFPSFLSCIFHVNVICLSVVVYFALTPQVFACKFHVFCVLFCIGFMCSHFSPCLVHDPAVPLSLSLFRFRFLLFFPFLSCCLFVLFCFFLSLSPSPSHITSHESCEKTHPTERVHRPQPMGAGHKPPKQSAQGTWTRSLVTQKAFLHSKPASPSCQHRAGGQRQSASTFVGSQQAHTTAQAVREGSDIAPCALPNPSNGNLNQLSAA